MVTRDRKVSAEGIKLDRTSIASYNSEHVFASTTSLLLICLGFVRKCIALLLVLAVSYMQRYTLKSRSCQSGCGLALTIVYAGMLIEVRCF